MEGSQTALKRSSEVVLAAMGLLLLGSIVFYRERILFADSAYIVFDIINYHSLAIQEHRYGSFITQAVPYLGQLFHIPLKAILVGYSMSFNLFYFTVAAILVYRFRQFYLAILMALYYFLLVSQSYFWINNEIEQAVSWMFLLLGFTIYAGHKGADRPMFLVPFCVLAFLTVFTHFIVIIPLGFLWVFLWTEGKYWPFSPKGSSLLSAILVVLIGAKYLFSVLHPSWDSNHLHGVTHCSIKDIIHSFGTPVVQVFLQRCITNYWPALVVLVIGMASLLRKREWGTAAWVLVSLIGYMVIMGLTYGGADDGKIHLFHIESEWQSVAIIVSTPFVYSFLPGRKQVTGIWMLAAVFMVRLYAIISVLPLFQERNTIQERILSQMKQKSINRLVIYDNIPAINERYMLYWGACYESLLSSAMKGEDPQKVFFFVNKDDHATLNSLTPDKFYTGFGVIPVSTLNRAYFSIDTTHTYQIMTYDELMK